MENNLRIAAIIGKMVSGGVESVVFNYARVLQKTDSRIAFDFYYDDDSTKQPPEDLLLNDNRFYKIPRYEHPFAFLKALLRCFNREKYCIVHSHLNTMSFLPLLAAKRAGIPVRVCHNHSTSHGGEGLKTVLKKLLRRPSAKLATDWFACGDKAAVWMYGEKAFREGRVTVLKNAVDPERFAFSEDARAAVRQELGIPMDAFVVGHIGRFCYPKNHAQLLKIFAAVKKRRPDAVLVLIGEGGLLEETRLAANKAGLADAVLFAGVRPDTDRCYSAFDVFCLPSFYEGLPVVAVEAQWNGVPCVFSDEITDEVRVNPNVTVLPLSAEDALWADAAVSAVRVAPAPGMSVFDVRASAEKLRAFYLSKADAAREKQNA